MVIVPVEEGAEKPKSFSVHVSAETPPVSGQPAIPVGRKVAAYHLYASVERRQTKQRATKNEQFVFLRKVFVKALVVSVCVGGYPDVAGEMEGLRWNLLSVKK